MTEAMKITLSTQPADARWGEKATYSINNDGITLHLNGKDDLGLIQRAARKIDGLGIKHVQLDGEGWDTERSWAFWQGYKGPKGTRKVEWAALDEAQRKELDSRLKIIDWVRDTINAPAEELVNVTGNISEIAKTGDGAELFSAFALENVALLREGHVALAALYAGGSVAVGVLLAGAGYWLAR